jgi:hypothetical protein
LVGARNNDDDGPNSGSAYIFKHDGTAWVEDAKLTASNAAEGDNFGGAVSVDGGIAVVGAREHDLSGSRSGAAYVYLFDGEGWVEGAILTPSPGQTTWFGYAVAVSGDRALVGDWGGAVYVFGGLSDCNTNGELDLCEVLAQTSQDCQPNLTPDECEPDCDTDGTPDDCEVDTLEQDCDVDGICNGEEIAGCLPGDLTCADCDSNGVPDGCQFDCDTDGTPDACEADVAQQDCNTDGVCNGVEIAACPPGDVACADCNTNGMSDECDLASGESEDLNSNGIPDECDPYCSLQAVHELVEVVAPAGAADDFFAWSVSVSGQTVVAGAFEDDDACPDDPDCDSGAAYVFRLYGGTYTGQAKLTVSDVAAGDEFGYAVAADADTIVIGAWRDDDACPADPACDSGSAYVFRSSGGTWVEQAKLTASDAQKEDYFGIAVAIQGDWAVVGARGAAYVFMFDGTSWSEEAKLTAWDGMGGAFGDSVSIDGQVILIGAKHQDLSDDLQNAGAVYVFRFYGVEWIPQQKLTASDAAAWDNFGRSVSVSGDAAVIGAYGDNVGELMDTGSAYVFRVDGEQWTEEAKLLADDAEQYDSFGWSVAMSGDVVVVGALHATGPPQWA